MSTVAIISISRLSLYIVPRKERSTMDAYLLSAVFPVKFPPKVSSSRLQTPRAHYVWLKTVERTYP